MTVRLVGLDNVLRNLNNEVRQIERLSMAGLWEAGLKIEASAKNRTPVDTGNLKGSAYTRKAGDKAIEIGFTAYYAVYVHENLEAHHPVGEAKFLERAITDNADRIIEIIKYHARVQ